MESSKRVVTRFGVNALNGAVSPSRTAAPEVLGLRGGSSGGVHRRSPIVRIIILDANVLQYEGLSLVADRLR